MCLSSTSSKHTSQTWSKKCSVPVLVLEALCLGGIVGANDGVHELRADVKA